MSDFASLLDSCRTVHAFEPNSISESDLMSCLEQSLKAPNHKFTFPWRYVWADETQKERIAELAVSLKYGEEQADASAIAGLKSKFLNPEIVVFCQKCSDDPFQAKEDYATMSCSVQLFALALAEKGIGYKWSTGGITRDAQSYKILNIDPSEHEIIGFVFVGRASSQAKPRRRPQLNDVLAHGDKL